MIVFLDRDGVINQMGKGYITNPDDLHLIPGSGKAIKLLNDLGFTIIVVTNQSMVGNGLLTHRGIRILHNQIDELLKSFGAEIDHFLYAWGTKQEPCNLRKPQIGMFSMAEIMYDFDPQDCWIVGDNKSDIEFGQKGNLNTILVQTGEGKKWKDQCTPDYICADLFEAVNHIKGKLK